MATTTSSTSHVAVRRTWWLVLPRAIALQGSVLVQQLVLPQEKADAHDKRTLTLPDVDGRVQALAAVVHDVRADDAGFACQHIHLHDAARSAEDVVGEWAVTDATHAGLRAQVNLHAAGTLDDVVEADGLAAL